jgi:tRNA modification GTPase
MSFSTRDTIVAIATPPGRGGIGIVRLSGPAAHAIARELLTHDGPLVARHATLTRVRVKVRSNSDETIDQAVALYFPAPRSYTGDDVVEVSVHGSPVVLRAIVTAAIEHGARLAEPGEFTLRAFLNGRIDLTQAEAIADLIDAVTPLQARAAFDQLDGTLTRTIAAIDAHLFDLIARLEASVDFPDEGYHFVDPGALAHAIDGLLDETTTLLAGARRGRLIREGVQVAIVGKPNVGKSSLFNALLGTARAIVTPTPGTTRDLITEVVDIEGVRVTLVDTAGLREASDLAEVEGVERSRQAVGVSDLVLQVIDNHNVPDVIDRGRHLIVKNKSDIEPASAAAQKAGVLAVSARTGDGLPELRHRLVTMLDTSGERERPDITNVRHIALVERAREALERARAAALSETGAMPEEFVLADLQDARAALEEVTGRRAPDEVLTHIFSRFCIGK